jgi:hypothetical protein
LASFIFLSDAPWLFYQNAEYLFHTHTAEWPAFKFVCGWLRGDLLSIHSAQEQEFIYSKIKVVLECNSPMSNSGFNTFFCPWGDFFFLI